MKFICDYFKGKKKLLTKKKARILQAPRRIEGLSLSDLWLQYQNDTRFTPYWPTYTHKAKPNRNFFFIILASIAPKEYEELLENLDLERLNKLKSKNKAIELNEDLVNSYLKVHEKYEFIKTKKIKRVVLNKNN